jgi:hypothetical protein
MYIDIPKTGSTSLVNSIGRGYDPFQVATIPEKFGTINEHTMRHLSSLEIYRSLPRRWENSYKMTVMRNPYSRAVSYYAYIHRLSKECPFESFEQFVDTLYEEGPHYFHYRHSPNTTRHLLPQCYMVMDESERVLVDYIGKMEHMQHSINEAMKEIGRHSTPIPMMNTSKHKPYKDYYNSNTRYKIGHMYEMDLDLGGYVFG